MHSQPKDSQSTVYAQPATETRKWKFESGNLNSNFVGIAFVVNLYIKRKANFKTGLFFVNFS
jgi:hypothetical protein